MTVSSQQCYVLYCESTLTRGSPQTFKTSVVLTAVPALVLNNGA